MIPENLHSKLKMKYLGRESYGFSGCLRDFGRNLDVEGGRCEKLG
jgi:hypothetical protein